MNWIKCSDKKPDIGRVYLVCSKLRMNWIKASEKQPEYDTPVLAFVGCTCGSGQKEEIHKLNCMFYGFYIATWREKDKYLKDWYDTYPEKKPNCWKYEDYWSPSTPDFWMPIYQPNGAK